MSWTLTKKLDFRLRVQARSRGWWRCWAESPEEIKGREVELGSETELDLSFASVVSQQQCYGHCPCDSALHSS